MIEGDGEDEGAGKVDLSARHVVSMIVRRAGCSTVLLLADSASLRLFFFWRGELTSTSLLAYVCVWSISPCAYFASSKDLGLVGWSVG